MLTTTRRLKRRLWYPARGAARALRWPEDARVHFVVAGAQKSGTTALDACLRQHPGVAMSLVKEAHFFDDESHFQSNRPAYWKYHCLFPAYRPDTLFGETTPSYMYWNPAFERIARYNPAMRILMVLRNPIDRAYSHWNMSMRAGQDTLSFRDAIGREAERSQRVAPRQSRRFSYVDRGFYSQQIARALEHFPRGQLFAVKHDDLESRPQAVMNDVFRFLGVAPVDIRPRRMNSSSYVEPMRREDRRLLRHLYADEIRDLERLLDWDCSAWLRG